MFKTKKIVSVILATMIVASMSISAFATTTTNASETSKALESSLDKLQINEDGGIELNTEIQELPTGTSLLEISEEEVSFPQTRVINNINNEINQTSGNLTQSNTTDFYFIDIPATRSLLYAVTSNNTDINVRLCTYDAATGTAYPTNYYSEVNKVGALNSLPADKYILMVTYSNNYTTAAPYNLYTNYSIQYRQGMSFVDFTNNLDVVMTRASNELYLNSRSIATLNDRNYIDYQKLFYLSPYQYEYGVKVSYGSILMTEYDELGNTIYGTSISSSSGIVNYVSPKYTIENAVLLYVDSDNMAKIRRYLYHNEYEEWFVDVPSGSFIVYDYDNNQYVDFYLNHPDVPIDHRLLYLTEN